MRLTLRHEDLPPDLDGLLFTAPLLVDAKNIYNSGGGVDALAPATQVVDALGTFIHPDTALITPAQANVLRIGSGIDKASRHLGALLESARTNSCLQSEEFDNASWTKTRSTVAADDTTAPDGNLTADKIVEDSSASDSHILAQSITLTSGQKVAISIFVKKGERSEIKFVAGGTAAPANAFVWFDLNAGTKGTVGAGVDGSGMDDMGEGWYRCWLVFTADASDTFNFTVQLSSGGETNIYNGDGSSGLYLWGAQCEQNARFPSSYIKTTNAAVTRAADNLRYDNTSEANIKGAAGTLYFARTSQGEIGTNNRVFGCLASGPNNGIKFYTTSSGDGVCEIHSGGSQVAGLGIGQMETRGTTFVIAIAWAANDFRGYVDGTEKATDTVGDAPTTMHATMHINASTGGASDGPCHFAHFHIYDSAHDAARILKNTKWIRKRLGLAQTP